MDLSDINKRLESIEQRLNYIERYLQLPPERPVISATQSQPTSTMNSTTVPSQEAKPGNWLGIIAVICFVLAAGFIIKLTIDSGWLNPERQLGLAYLFGICLIGTGFMLKKSDKEYASLLPGTGIIVLYLTTFAGQQLYHLFPLQLALTITSVISLLCIFLYYKLRHDLYALTAAIGAYLSPIILGLDITVTFPIYYFVMCSIAFATISVWLQSRIFTMIAAYLAILVNAYIGFTYNVDAMISIILALHFVIFSISVYCYSVIHKTQLTEEEAWSFFPVLLLFYAFEYYFMNHFNPRLAPWVSLSFANFILFLYIWAEEKLSSKKLNSQPMILAFVTIVFFHSLYLELLPAHLRPWLFSIILLAWGLFSNRVNHLKETGKYTIPIIAIFIVLIIEYLHMIGHLIFDYSRSWLMVSAAAFVSIWFLILKRTQIDKQEEFKYGLLSAAHLLAITGAYQLTTDQGSLAVSASWLIYAVLVIAIAFVRHDKLMAKSAIIILSFSAAKALLYDASSTPTLIRIFCLLLTGVVLYGAGFLLRKITTWRDK